MTQVTLKSYSMEDIAKALGARLEGDGGVKVTRVAHPADVLSSEDLVLASDPTFMPLLEGGIARAAIVAEGTTPPKSLASVIYVGRSRYAMSKLTALFEDKVEVPAGIHPMAVIEEGAHLAEGVTVGAHTYIGKGAKIGKGSVIHPQVYIGPDVELGADALIYAGVRIGARVKIGARVIIHFNASIGADGFSFVTPEIGSVEAAKATGAIGEATNTRIERIASLGAVEMGDDVEVGANTAIDKGTIISTRIGSGTKIDNHVQVGHNVQIGENCMICGRTGIAGSAKIGNRVVLGGAVGVADHVVIGDDVVAMAMSGVTGKVAPKTVVGGLPAKPRNKFIKDMRNVARISLLSEKIKDLMQRLEVLEAKAK